MKTAAIVCEFNPFHNGHAHILRQLREECGADYIIAIMSGNYVQRGEPAIFDKYTRAAMALTGDGMEGLGHADLVLELPTVFSTAAAGDFAAAGVSIAAATGITDVLGFGVEENVSLADIEAQARLLNELDECDCGSYRINCSGNSNSSNPLKELLRSGMSYPEAVSEYLDMIRANDGGSQSAVDKGNEDAAEDMPQTSGNDPSVMYASNNILAAEYLRALRNLDKNGNIKAYAVARKGDSYSRTVPADEHFCSASSLRRLISEGIMEDSSQDHFQDNITDYIPRALWEEYALSKCRRAVHPDAFSDILNKELMRAKYRGAELTAYTDVSREIADRLLNRADRAMGFTERIADTKTKQYTYTRISRALLHIAVGVTTEESMRMKAAGYVPYLKLLGFRKTAALLLKSLKANASLPVITKTADHRELLTDEIYHSGIYYAVTKSRSEYERSPVVI